MTPHHKPLSCPFGTASRFAAGILVAMLCSGSAFSIPVWAQAPAGTSTLITKKVDDSATFTLRGNTRAEANAANDRGLAPESLAMEHMLLQLQRSPEQKQAAEQYLMALHDPRSPYFHRWLTPSEYGQRYGAAGSDIDIITGWLEAQGFVVNTVYPSGLTIDFSGTAGQVRKAFHTEIHNLEVNQETHVANMSDPQIPVALANAVVGIVSMNDFAPRPMMRPRTNYTFESHGATEHAITPGDLAGIYDFNPLFAAGITGTGQTIAVIEDTDLYKTSDWDTFRSVFGLAQYSAGNLSSLHPAGTGKTNCTAPGVVGGDDGEAILDAEWASAAAPSASIVVASCANTRSTFGGFIALENLINGATPPAIVSISYGECEAELGAAANAAVAALYQQAVAEAARRQRTASA
jgi:subtilase family serine protease